MKRNHQTVLAIVFIALLVTVAGCAKNKALPARADIRAPEPIQGNSGKYMSPYTSDKVLAQWVDTGLNAKKARVTGQAVGGVTGAVAGGAAGAVAEHAAGTATSNVPIIGGLLGSTVGGIAGAKTGGAAGRKIAIKNAGGMEAIKGASDLSFNSLEELAVYMYANYSNRPTYQEELKLVYGIYPKLEKCYTKAIRKARK